MKIDLEKLVMDCLKSETFAYQLAEIIASQYKEELFDEFGGEIAKEMHNKVETMSQQFVEDFKVEGDVKRLVRKTFDSISKKELLEVLKDESE
jgi:Ni,Fe-hydrogenase I small subunit